MSFSPGRRSVQKTSYRQISSPGASQFGASTASRFSSESHIAETVIGKRFEPWRTSFSFSRDLVLVYCFTSKMAGEGVLSGEHYPAIFYVPYNAFSVFYARRGRKICYKEPYFGRKFARAMMCSGCVRAYGKERMARVFLGPFFSLSIRAYGRDVLGSVRNHTEGLS